MKNAKIAEEVKNAIMKDLFADVDAQKCVIDIFLQNPKDFAKMESTINKVSVTFLNKCQQQLKAASDKGDIFFFRKYNYEKILNAYLSKTYKIETPEMELFPSEKKVKEEEEKRRREAEQIEKQRKLEEWKLLEEKKRKERERQEKEMIARISDLEWKKTVGVSRNVYETTFYDGKKLEFCVTRSTKKKNTIMSFVLLHDGKPFSCTEYDGKDIIQTIEETHPKVEKSNNLIYLVNTKASKKKKKAKAVDPETEKKRKEEEERLKEERRKLKEEQKKERIKEERLRQWDQQERARRAEAERQAEIRRLPQIDVKDFLVRRSVFKCMHSNHQVDDLAAAVRVVGDDGKARLVKITAGYCEQCRVYFILESTYIRLRNMGVVLCRICDEKSYLKNSWINGMRLAQESILMQFGYTVSQEEDLSATKRRKILAVMIDNKVLSKSEIISYLDFFISQRQYQSKFELAVSKWEMDRDFVEEYRVGEYTQFGVNAIYRR